MNVDRPPSHPGEILRTLYLFEANTITEFAKKVGVSRKHMSKIINGKNRITPKMAIRIAKVLNTTPNYWLNLQNKVDLYNFEHAKSV